MSKIVLSQKTSSSRRRRQSRWEDRKKSAYHQCYHKFEGLKELKDNFDYLGSIVANISSSSPPLATPPYHFFLTLFF